MVSLVCTFSNVIVVARYVATGNKVKATGSTIGSTRFEVSGYSTKHVGAPLLT